jgi:hypothetical protein
MAVVVAAAMAVAPAAAMALVAAVAMAVVAAVAVTDGRKKAISRTEVFVHCTRSFQKYIPRKRGKLIFSSNSTALYIFVNKMTERKKERSLFIFFT